MDINIVQRLERVERSSRRLRVALGALFLGAILVVTMAAGKGVKKEIRAQSFVVVDEQGNMLAKLGEQRLSGMFDTEDDFVGLTLFTDKDSVDPVSYIGYYPDGYGLIKDSGPIPLVVVGLPGEKGGFASLGLVEDGAILHMERNTGSINFEVDNKGPKLTLGDKDDKTLFEAP